MKAEPISEADRYHSIERRILDISSPGIRPGLSRMARLCSLLGHPERTFPAVHVIGTNGKGSVCASIDSILRESGCRTARYTSPHLEHLGERLTFDNQPLPPSMWEEAVEQVSEAILSDRMLSEDPPSFFENLTAAAFLCIARGKRDFAVIEAGLGGRLDATNLLGRVHGTVFTSIGLDHEDILGRGLECIAKEKFAALRPRVPAVSASNGNFLDELVEDASRRLDSPLCILGKNAWVFPYTVGRTGSTFRLCREGFPPLDLSTPLLGKHQVVNAGLAALACLGLSGDWPRMNEDAIREGLRKTVWAGRMEVVALNPPVLLDGAHNPQGAEMLAGNVRSLWPETPVALVMAAMKDKDLEGMLRALSLLGGNLFCTEVPGLDRSETAQGLAKKALSLPWPGKVRAFSDPEEALLEASGTSPLVLCTGSLYFIGRIRRHLIKKCTGTEAQG